MFLLSNLAETSKWLQLKCFDVARFFHLRLILCEVKDGICYLSFCQPLWRCIEAGIASLCSRKTILIYIEERKTNRKARDQYGLETGFVPRKVIPGRVADTLFLSCWRRLFRLLEAFWNVPRTFSWGMEWLGDINEIPFFFFFYIGGSDRALLLSDTQEMELQIHCSISWQSVFLLLFWFSVSVLFTVHRDQHFFLRASALQNGKEKIASLFVCCDHYRHLVCYKSLAMGVDDK